MLNVFVCGQVIVSDMGPSPRHTPVCVIVHILDENDNEPHFSEKLYQLWVPEHDRGSRGEPLCRVFASDRDLGPNADLSYSIVDGNQDSNFAIDPKTAMVMSQKTMAAGTSALLTVCSTATKELSSYRTNPILVLLLVFDLILDLLPDQSYGQWGSTYVIHNSTVHQMDQQTCALTAAPAVH